GPCAAHLRQQHGDGTIGGVAARLAVAAAGSFAAVRRSAHAVANGVGEIQRIVSNIGGKAMKRTQFLFVVVFLSIAGWRAQAAGEDELKARRAEVFEFTQKPVTTWN